MVKVPAVELRILLGAFGADAIGSDFGFRRSVHLFIEAVVMRLVKALQEPLFKPLFGAAMSLAPAQTIDSI